MTLRQSSIGIFTFTLQANAFNPHGRNLNYVHLGQNDFKQRRLHDPRHNCLRRNCYRGDPRRNQPATAYSPAALWPCTCRQNGEWKMDERKGFTFHIGIGPVPVSQFRQAIWQALLDALPELEFKSDVDPLLVASGEWRIQTAPAPGEESGTDQIPATEGCLSRQRPGLLIEADPPTALLCWHREGWKLICLDTRNYWDKSPPTLAESATLPLMSTPTDDDRPEAWQLYCEQLCRVTQQCVARLAGWHKQQNQGHWAFTVSGMALAAFRHKYLYHAVQCPAEQDDRDFDAEPITTAGANRSGWGRSAIGGFTPLTATGSPLR